MNLANPWIAAARTSAGNAGTMRSHNSAFGPIVFEQNGQPDYGRIAMRSQLDLLRLGQFKQFIGEPAFAFRIRSWNASRERIDRGLNNRRVLFLKHRDAGCVLRPVGLGPREGRRDVLPHARHDLVHHVLKCSRPLGPEFGRGFCRTFAFETAVADASIRIGNALSMRLTHWRTARTRTAGSLASRFRARPR